MFFCAEGDTCILVWDQKVQPSGLPFFLHNHFRNYTCNQVRVGTWLHLLNWTRGRGGYTWGC
jgi:hypothetical protein